MKIKVFNIRLSKEFLETDQIKLNEFLENVIFKKSTASLIESSINYWTILVHYEERDSSKFDMETKKQSEISDHDLTKEELEIVKNIKDWRSQKATEEGLPAYMILTNSNIYSLARYKPNQLSDFLTIKGFGEKKSERYADELIALFNSL